MTPAEVNSIALILAGLILGVVVFALSTVRGR